MTQPEFTSNETVLITGGSKRLGASIAHACAKAGMNCVIHYHQSKHEADELIAQLETFGVHAWAINGDLTSDNDCTTLISRAQDMCTFPLYALVNNASVFPKSSLLSVSYDALLESIRLNAWAPLALSRAFWTQTQKGCIVNLLDNRIHSGDPQHVAYILSKQMLASLTLMCAKEFAPHVRVNGVAPGLILAPQGETDSYLDRLSKTVPLQKRGFANNISDTVLFCIKNSFLTGEIITVDGGKHLATVSQKSVL